MATVTSIIIRNIDTFEVKQVVRVPDGVEYGSVAYYKYLGSVIRQIDPDTDFADVRVRTTDVDYHPHTECVSDRSD